MSVSIQLRRDTAANWTSVNPVLYQGELGIETDTEKVKLGDGETAWNSLAYWSAGGIASFSVASANGFAGVISGSPTNPVVTLESTPTGVLKSNGTAVSAAVAGTDYVTPTGSGAGLTGITYTQVGADASGAAAAVEGLPLGLTGATSATRYAGGTASVAPTSGTFAVGDYVVGQTGSIFVCTSAGTPGTWVSAGILNSTTGTIAATPGTAAAGSSGQSARADHVHGQPTNFAPTGLTGATSASRYVGATTSSSPASGTFVVGDFVIDQTGKIWICTTAGSPGSWQLISRRDSAASDIQAVGTAASAGATFLAADSGHVHATSEAWTLGDTSLLGWSFDPIVTNGSNGVATLGTVQLTRINVRAAISVTNVLIYVGVIGSGLTSGQNFVGLYNSSGTLVGTSADQTAAWGSTGLKTAALTGGPFALSTGFYWAAILVNASTTSPAFMRANENFSGFLNVGVTASTARSGSGPASQTSLPSITPSSISLGSQAFWAALS